MLTQNNQQQQWDQLLNSQKSKSFLDSIAQELEFEIEKAKKEAQINHQEK